VPLVIALLWSVSRAPLGLAPKPAAAAAEDGIEDVEGVGVLSPGSTHTPGTPLEPLLTKSAALALSSIAQRGIVAHIRASVVRMPDAEVVGLGFNPLVAQLGTWDHSWGRFDKGLGFRVWKVTEKLYINKIRLRLQRNCRLTK
jgi:hypothetical protein